MVTSPVREGEVLAEKYRVLRVLAEGGMGVVVAARHLKLQHLVALKLMQPELQRHPEAAARFLREARIAAQLRSEHAARILDIGELPSGLPYIVMELLEGSDLGAVMQTAAPMTVEDAVDIVLQACEAIAEAHGLGIVHRDLKPENLFVTRRRDGAPWIKVVDFGISKVEAESRRDGARITTREAMGSPTYMAPEQMRSTRDVDGRADIWSLGVILYELCTGRQPFEGDSLAEVCLKVMQDPPPPFTRADLPEGFAAVVLKCLEKDPALRHATIAELVRALAPFAPRQAQAVIDRAIAEPRPPREEAIEQVSPPTVRTRGRSTLGQGTARRRALLVAGIAVALATLGGVSLVGRDPAPTVARASAPAPAAPPAAIAPALPPREEAPPATAEAAPPAPSASTSAAPPKLWGRLGTARPRSAGPRGAKSAAEVAPKPADDDVFGARK